MTRHLDILDQPESLRGSFAGALTLHVSVAAALLAFAWLQRPTERFGDQNASGAVSVGVVDKIPLPSEGVKNPVANDSQSETPQTPTVAPNDKQKTEKPPPDAVKLKNKKAKPTHEEQVSARQRFRNYKELQENQLTTQFAPRVSDPMFSRQTGSGNVGTGMNTTLGTRFAGYAAQIRDIVARNWKTGDVDARYQTAPQVIASFELMRDGSVRNVTIVQRIGIPSLDLSVRRAIEDSNPLPPIPPGFDKNSAMVEFTFELKR